MEPVTDTTTETAAETQVAAGDQQEQKTLTQADVDRIVKDRIARVEAKYADYNDLKAQAAGARTLEERLGALEGELNRTRSESARTRVAAKFGISTEPGANGEPSDAEVLLTGSDEAAMTKQAERLAGRIADQKTSGNRAPKEGRAVTTTDDGDRELREFARSLFAAAQNE